MWYLLRARFFAWCFIFPLKNDRLIWTCFLCPKSYVRSALCALALRKTRKKKRKAKRETEMGEESEEGERDREGEPLATAGEALVLVLVPGSGEGGKGKGSSAQSIRGIGEVSAEWTSPRPPGRVSVLRGSCGSCSWARFAARAPPGE
jgi:hypothetical protein